MAPSFQMKLFLHQFDVFGKKCSDHGTVTLHGNNVKEQSIRISSDLLPLCPTIDVPYELKNADWHVVLPEIDRESFLTLFHLLSDGTRKNVEDNRIILANLQTRLLSLGWIIQDDGAVIPYKLLEEDAFLEFVNSQSYKLLRELSCNIKIVTSKSCNCKENEVSSESGISVSSVLNHNVPRSPSPFTAGAISSTFSDKKNNPVKELKVIQSSSSFQEPINEIKKREDFGTPDRSTPVSKDQSSNYSAQSNERNLEEIEREFDDEAKIALEANDIVLDIELDHNLSCKEEEQKFEDVLISGDQLEEEIIVNSEIHSGDFSDEPSDNYHGTLNHNSLVMEDESHEGDFSIHSMDEADELMPHNRFEISCEGDTNINDHKIGGESTTEEVISSEISSQGITDNHLTKQYHLRKRKKRSMNGNDLNNDPHDDDDEAPINGNNNSNSISNNNTNNNNSSNSSSSSNNNNNNNNNSNNNNSTNNSQSPDKLLNSEKVRQPPKPIGLPNETDPLLTGFETEAENSIESWPLAIPVPEKIDRVTASRIIVGIKRGELYYLSMTNIRQIITTSPTFGSGHTKEGTKICVFCGAAGLKLQNLYNHIQMHHSNFITTCALCDQVCISENRLLSHLNIRHPRATAEIAKSRAQCRFKLFRTDEKAFQAGADLILSGQVKISSRLDNIIPRGTPSSRSLRKRTSSESLQKSSSSTPSNGHSNKMVIQVPKSTSDSQSAIPKLRIVTQSDRSQAQNQEHKTNLRFLDSPIFSDKRMFLGKSLSSDHTVFDKKNNINNDKDISKKIQKFGSRTTSQGASPASSRSNKSQDAQTSLKVCYECHQQSEFGGFINETGRFYCLDHNPFSNSPEDLKNQPKSSISSRESHSSLSPVSDKRHIQTFSEKVAMFRNIQKGKNTNNDSNSQRLNESNLSTSNLQETRPRKTRKILSPAQVINLRKSALQPVGLDDEKSPLLSGHILASESTIDSWPLESSIPEVIDEPTRARILVGMKRGLLYPITMLKLAQIFTTAPTYSINDNEFLVCILCGSARYVGCELHHHTQRIHTSYHCECPSCHEIFLTEPSFVAHVISHPNCPHPKYDAIWALGNVLSSLKMKPSSKRAKQVGNSLVALGLVKNAVSFTMPNDSSKS